MSSRSFARCMGSRDGARAAIVRLIFVSFRSFVYLFLAFGFGSGFGFSSLPRIGWREENKRGKPGVSLVHVFFLTVLGDALGATPIGSWVGAYRLPASRASSAPPAPWLWRARFRSCRAPFSAEGRTRCQRHVPTRPGGARVGSVGEEGRANNGGLLLQVGLAGLLALVTTRHCRRREKEREREQRSRSGVCGVQVGSG